MFYVWQMNNHRWQVSAYTSAPKSAHHLAWDAPSFETRAEAEQWAREASATWADAAKTAAALAQPAA